MNDFYQNYLTDKSFLLLSRINKKYKFVLIGGWAVYFYTQALKSKDIDIIVDFGELNKIKNDFPLEKNERLKKYQIKIEEIDIDIYLPYYSDLGIPTEDILKKTTVFNGFTLPQKELLLFIKLNAYQDRKASVKGQKDAIDIVSLIVLPGIDFDYLLSLIVKYKGEKYLEILKEIITKLKEVPELNLNEHAFSKVRKKILGKLE